MGSQKQGSVRLIYGCLFRNVSVQLFSVKMQGSHLISPCVWQNDVNRTLFCSENIRLDKRLPNIPNTLNSWSFRCYAGGTTLEMFDFCLSFEYNLLIKILRNGKCSDARSMVVALTVNQLCQNLSKTCTMMQGPPNSLCLKHFDTLEESEICFESQWKPLIHLLLLCPSFLISCNSLSVSITIMWRSRKMSRPDVVACGLSIGFGLMHRAFKWLFRKLRLILKLLFLSSDKARKAQWGLLVLEKHKGSEYHITHPLFEEQVEKSLILAVRYIVLNSPKTKRCSLFNFFCFLLSIAGLLF